MTTALDPRFDPLRVADQIAGGIHRGDPDSRETLGDSIAEAQLYALVSIAESLKGIERALNRRGIGGPF